MYEASVSGTGCLGCLSGFVEQMVEAEQRIRAMPTSLAKSGAQAALDRQMLLKIRELEAALGIPELAQTSNVFSARLQATRILPAGLTRSGAEAAIRRQIFTKLRELEAATPIPEVAPEITDAAEAAEEAAITEYERELYAEAAARGLPGWVLPVVGVSVLGLIAGGIVLVVKAKRAEEKEGAEKGEAE